MDDSCEVLTRSAPGPDRVERYGPGADQVVEVWSPSGRKRAAALVVVLHGGFWRAAYDRVHVRPMCNALAAQGYAVASVEYRRTGDGGGWPATLTDVAVALDAVPALLAEAARPGGWVLVGHSAGGHLALWAASRHRLPLDAPWWRAEPLPAAGVLSLAGVCDLGAALELGVGGGAAAELLSDGRETRGDTAAAGGAEALRRERAALADPMELVGGGVRSVLLHGDADTEVPVALSLDYALAATAEGDPAEVRVLPGAGHYGLIDPLSPQWPHVLRGIADLTPG